MQFAPDLDPVTHGVLTNVINCIPTVKGYAGAYTGLDAGYDAIAASVRNLVITYKLDNTRRLFSATQTKIYEGSGGTWTSVEDGTPDIGSANRWSFAQFGDTTLATAKAEYLQASSAGAFTTVAGAPMAACIATGSGFVMAVNTYDAGYGDSPDRWWCSAIYDHEDWTPSTTTQCTTGRLVDTPGPLNAVVGYGSTFVAFKNTSMYVATYVAAPSVFQWQLVPGEVGCMSKDAIAQSGSQIYFVGSDNFYTWDGSRPIPIGNPLREWFYKTEVNPAYTYLMVANFDRANQFVWFFYPPIGSQTLDRALVYQPSTGKWGKVHLTVETAATYLSDPFSIHDLDGLSGTIDGLPDISYDSPYWTSQSQVMAYVDTAHTVKTMSGNCGNSSFTTGTQGDYQQFSTVKRIVPRYTVAPTSALLRHYYDNDYGDNFSVGPTSTLTNGSFDLMHSARWHKGKVEMTGNWEIIDYKVYATPDGEA